MQGTISHQVICLKRNPRVVIVEAEAEVALLLLDNLAQGVKRKVSRRKSIPKERRPKTKRVPIAKANKIKTEEAVTESTLTVRVMKLLMIRELCSRREMVDGT
jgi:hypothetical protein